MQPIAASTSADGSSQRYRVPKISIHDLRKSDINLHKILHESGGVLRISTRLDDDSFIHNMATFRKKALSALCTCPLFEKSSSSNADDLFEKLSDAHPKDIQQIDLPDGSIRRTLATATVGFEGHDDSESSHPLQLTTLFKEQCGQPAYDSVENLRDAISKVVSLFVGKLDDEKQRDQSYRQVLQSANHLEHFHVYYKDGLPSDDVTSTFKYEDGNVPTRDLSQRAPGALINKRGKSKTTKSTFDYHTDAGFFLSFVPSMDCGSSKVDNTSFYIKSQEQPLQIEEDEVVILLGAGAQYWMNNNPDSSDSFVAAPHALRLLPGAHRSWYGKMHLLPASLTSNAFESSFGYQHASSVKYGDVLPTFQLENYQASIPSAPVDGCGTNPLKSQDLVTHSEVEIRQNRRRLQHVGSPANCNNETNFFCWYQCLSIPNADFTLDYLRDGYSLYCLDPSMLGDNPVGDAAAPCKGGYTHNSDCSGSWQLTDENLPGYEFPSYEAALTEEDAEKAAAAAYPEPDSGDEYCYGGTSMYMDGFNWIGSTCVIYLFPQWVLSTPGKFAVACIGSILFGILLEFVLWKRRVVYAMKPGRHRLVASILAYGLQLSMGYFIMLVIMTYSGPLFICTVGGMMAGHAIFNAQDSFMKVRANKVPKNSQDAGTGTSELGQTERNNSTELAGTYQNVRSDSRSNSELDEEAIGGCCGSGTKSPSKKSYGATEETLLRKDSVPEGATPCCQYNL